MADKTQDQLVALYKKVEALAPLGANAMHRRSLAIIAKEIQQISGQQIFPLCFPEDGHGGGPRDRSVAKADATFRNTYLESKSDDRRRSIFLDAEEALAAQFIDFYTDRIDAFEIRHGGSITNELRDSSHRRAIEFLKAYAPAIKVLPIAAESMQALIDSLKALAHLLEQRQKSGQADLSVAEFPEFEVLFREICTHVGTEAGTTRWADNGTKLEQQIRDVYRCIDEDACCENQAYTKQGPWRWVEIWDDGNSSNPPPSNPPPYQQRPWDNRCRVFPAGTGGTVTSDWGWRTIDGNTDFHPGMDIGVPPGTIVIAAVAGQIVHINRTSPGGATGVIIRTGNEIRQYWHIDPETDLRVGQQVQAGAFLGTVANMPGPHLHFACFTPPNGDWTKKSDANSIEPCP
jgi:murein DD-endopeptidase MepM/ murein hydrolase activator NlpD